MKQIFYGLDWLLGTFCLVVLVKMRLSFAQRLVLPKKGARALVRSDDAKQVFDVRLNGVRAICTRHKSGGTMVALSVGLKIKRSLAEGAENDVVAVPMMSAIVDDQQAVISNDEFGYIVGFDKGVNSKYPS